MFRGVSRPRSRPLGIMYQDDIKKSQDTVDESDNEAENMTTRSFGVHFSIQAANMYAK